MTWISPSALRAIAGRQSFSASVVVGTWADTIDAKSRTIMIRKRLGSGTAPRQRSLLHQGGEMRRFALLCPIALSACVSNNGGPHPLRPHDLATGPYQSVATTAYTGSLMYEGGCLLFHDEADKVQVLPVWPFGSIFNGSFVTFHRPGKADQRFVVGEEIQLEGQPVAWPALSGPVYEPFQRQCGSPAFAVSRVRPAN